MFSPSQKAFKKVVLITINVNMNCCKACSTSYWLPDDVPPQSAAESSAGSTPQSTQSAASTDPYGSTTATTQSAGSADPYGSAHAAWSSAQSTGSGSAHAARSSTKSSAGSANSEVGAAGGARGGAPYFWPAAGIFEVVRYVPQVTETEFVGALRLLRRWWPAECWDLFHKNVCHTSMFEHNRLMLGSMAMHWQCSSGASALKLMSYFGAIKAHQGIRACHVFAYDRRGLGFFDAGNACYTWVVMKVWPLAFSESGISNEEKVGDVVEAFLGFRWFFEHPDNVAISSNDKPLKIINALDQVIAYVYDNWDQRESLDWRFSGM